MSASHEEALKRPVVERAESPTGYIVHMRQQIGSTEWLVNVYDFATWRHRRFTYPTEAEARAAFALWSL